MIGSTAPHTERSGSTFGQRAYEFYADMAAPPVPPGVEVMNPYADEGARGYTRQFLHQYFSDDNARTLVFGINPGRFGAGVTGVTFIDPVALADMCGIVNTLPRRRELSSEFVTAFIDHMGGPVDFYSRFFLTAISPLGFTRGGRNLNYYDEPLLQELATPFILNSIRRQIDMGGRPEVAIVLGAGANLRFMQRLNDTHKLFDRLVGLDHPRFIMQYRRKRVSEYLISYSEAFAQTSP